MNPLAQKPPTKFKKKFFNSNLHDITVFEQLCSSICCWVMAAQSLAWKGKLCLFWKVLN